MRGDVIQLPHAKYYTMSPLDCQDIFYIFKNIFNIFSPNIIRTKNITHLVAYSAAYKGHAAGFPSPFRGIRADPDAFCRTPVTLIEHTPGRFAVNADGLIRMADGTGIDIRPFPVGHIIFTAGIPAALRVSSADTYFAPAAKLLHVMDTILRITPQNRHMTIPSHTLFVGKLFNGGLMPRGKTGLCNRMPP